MAEATRAYPVAYLTEREMVDDAIGHTPFVVTWCPVCYSAVVFDRRIDGRTYVFGNNSRLYMRNLTMWDHESGSIWSQLDGTAILGPLMDTRLRMLPATLETWRAWRSEHPGTTALAVPAGFHTVTTPPFVVGMVVGGASVAFRYGFVKRRGVVDGSVGGRPIVVYAGPGQRIRVFSRRVAGRVVQFTLRHGSLVDRLTTTSWDPATGIGRDGPLAGHALDPLPYATAVDWAWEAFHPGMPIVG
jgi:hypothetical protein